MEFKGKVAVVTGGAKGIGLAISLGLAKGGGLVVIGDLDQEAGTKAVQKIGARTGSEAFFVPTDVEREEDIKARMNPDLGEFGRVDIRGRTAGICPSGDMVDIGLEEWDRVININLRSVFLASKKVAPIMREKGSGVILNISSIAGKTGGAAVGAHYSASKAGVISLTKTFAKVLAPHRVRVNAICPGPVETDMTASLTEAERRIMTANSPLGAMAKPEEISGPALFLLSPAASHITGEIMDVNGGLWMD